MFTFNDAVAQKAVDAKSIGFEESTIIEFENTEQSNSEINTIRMWLGSDFTFKSFKTEKGWTGTKTPQGVIVFTTTTPIKSGEVVKFGIKTDKPKPGINWKALDEDDVQIGTGKTLVSESTVIEPLGTSNGDAGVLSSSTFRLIPEKPNVGSTMRIAGDNFGANQKLEFFIEDEKLESLETDDQGNFMITSSVPEDIAPGRVNFIIKDLQGNEKSISLRVGESEDRMAATENIPLTIDSSNPIVYRGDLVKVSGTGQPGGTVTATIKDVNGNILTTIAVDIDFDGNWEYETIVPPDAQLGKQTAEITDGTDNILRSFVVESSKKINIVPLKLKFEPGDIIIFNGTAIPNQELEAVIENPQGGEVFSDVINVGGDGDVNIEFLTEQSSLEGTYVLFASQGDETEIILVGLGELPEEQLVVKLDKLNYIAGSNATLSLNGPASATISLLIVDPSDKNKFSDTVILGPDGNTSYELDLSGYGSGVYTAVITRGNAQTSDIFSVGLQHGSGPIEVRTTKETYAPGESVLVLGSSGENILIDLTLINELDEVVKEKQTFTNKDGVFSEGSFRIPIDGQVGTWTINAKSGPNFANAEITVVGDVEEGMVVLVESIEPFPGGGDIVNISGYGARINQDVDILILSDIAEEVAELSARATGVGDFSIPWVVGTDIAPGTYTIIATSPDDEAITTFVLE